MFYLPFFRVNPAYRHLAFRAWNIHHKTGHRQPADGFLALALYGYRFFKRNAKTVYACHWVAHENIIRTNPRSRKRAQQAQHLGGRVHRGLGHGGGVHRAAAARASAVSSSEQLNCVLTQTFFERPSILAILAVTRLGFVHRALVHTRTTSTCGSSANASTKRISAPSESVMASPPERSTSRTLGLALTYSTQRFRSSCVSTVSVRPKSHWRVQWRQFMKHLSVVITRTRSGNRCLTPLILEALASSPNGSCE